MEKNEHIDSTPTLRKAAGHFRTITKHKVLVGQLCFKVGLYRQGVAHDLSKYAPAEFMVGARYFTGKRSPNDGERRDIGFSPSWIHHKGRNKHHFEYWMDIDSIENMTVVGKPMPTRYVIEMLCDRIAACRIYQGKNYTQESALAFFMRQDEGGYNELMHPDTRDLLRTLLRIIAEEGEDAGLERIKREYVQPKASYGNGIRW